MKIIILLFVAQFWIGCDGLGFLFCADYHFYLESDTNRLLEVKFGIGGIKECTNYGKLTFIERLSINWPINCVTTVNAEGMEKMRKLCPEPIKRDRFISSLILDKIWKAVIPSIYPGTVWCGAGNISNGLDHLGASNKLDACCRKHDSCPDYITTGDTKYGITNDKIGTISACFCDDGFFDCLHNVDNVQADNVGFLFFDVLGMPCFKEDYPIVKCLKRGGFFNSQCEEYELDNSKPKEYQLFDPKVYRPQ